MSDLNDHDIFYETLARCYASMLANDNYSTEASSIFMKELSGTSEFTHYECSEITKCIQDWLHSNQKDKHLIVNIGNILFLKDQFGIEFGKITKHVLNGEPLEKY